MDEDEIDRVELLDVEALEMLRDDDSEDVLDTESELEDVELLELLVDDVEDSLEADDIDELLFEDVEDSEDSLDVLDSDEMLSEEIDVEELLDVLLIDDVDELETDTELDELLVEDSEDSLDSLDVEDVDETEDSDDSEDVELLDVDETDETLDSELSLETDVEELDETYSSGANPNAVKTDVCPGSTWSASLAIRPNEIHTFVPAIYANSMSISVLRKLAVSLVEKFPAPELTYGSAANVPECLPVGQFVLSATPLFRKPL